LNDLAESSLGILRESQSLEDAIKKFDDIANEFRDVSRNENSYGAVELSHLALVGGIMAKAAAARKESRGLHYRSDFPATDPEWKKWLILRKGNATDELIWSTRANFLERWISVSK
jgi:aspartate oxidase